MQMSSLFKQSYLNLIEIVAVYSYTGLYKSVQAIMDCDSRVLALLVAWVPTYLVLIQDFCTTVPEGVLSKPTVELVTSRLVAPMLVPIFTRPR